MKFSESYSSPELRQPELGQKDTPRIYRLIAERAGTDVLADQIYKDFYAHDPEAVFLGLDELRSRGNEGIAALNFFAKSTDEFGKVAKALAEKIDMPQRELEKLLGVKRFGTITGIDDMVEAAFERTKSKGIIDRNMSFDEFVDRAVEQQNQSQRPGMLPPHFSGTIDQEVINSSSTFGTAEPAYLELLGPKEILKLREQKDPNFLLLGSYGKYSAQEFGRFAKNINPDANVNVIDVDDMTARIIKFNPDTPQNVTVADARELPFAAESMDTVCTNDLFHFIALEYDSRLKDIFMEAYRVLKKGGSFVIAEQVYGKYNSYGDIPKMQKELTAFAKQAGFNDIKVLKNELAFLLRSDVGSATLDQNGFAHYGNSLLLENEQPLVVQMRFVK